MAIKQEANRLKMKYQTTDPYDICTSMDIQVIKRPMGASAQSCKGFFLVSSRCKLIVINSDLPESIQRIIISMPLKDLTLLTLCVTPLEKKVKTISIWMSSTDSSGSGCIARMARLIRSLYI